MAATRGSGIDGARCCPRHRAAEAEDDDEWVVPIEWIETLPQKDAYWEKGLFANQNSACKLRQEFTLERLAQRFDVHNDGD